MTANGSPDTPWIRLDGGAGDARESERWPIVRSLVIGRERADVTIALACLSRRHARIDRDGAACRITDLGSKNGTAVNGRMIAGEPHELADGDVIVLAGNVELRFADPCATPFVPRLGKLEGVWIDPLSQDVWIDAERLEPPLSPKQLQLLRAITEADGGVLSKGDIIDALWPSRNADAISNDSVDSLVKRLRRRLAPIEHGRPVLEVVRGHGVRLRAGR